VSPSRVRSSLAAGITLAGGVALSIVPAGVLSVSSNTFSIADQGSIAVAVSIALFAGQLLFASVLESRLATPGRRAVAMPWWLTIVGLTSAAAIALFPMQPIVIMIALPAMIAALEVGRGVSVTEKYATREGWAAVVLGGGTGAAVLIAIAGLSWGFAILGVAAVAAIIIRSAGAPARSPAPDAITRRWVTADAALTGVTFPILNAAILALIGPVASTLFAAISTVSGLLSVPLNYFRVRILKESSVVDYVVTLAAMVLTVLAIGVGQALGLFSSLFGEVWTVEATTATLAVAVLWRVSTLVSAVPFGRLRRAGLAKPVMLIRGTSALITVALTVAASTTGLLWLVFLALTVGELILASICFAAVRRLITPHPHEENTP
jgi:hypothetical protein